MNGRALCRVLVGQIGQMSTQRLVSSSKVRMSDTSGLRGVDEYAYSGIAFCHYAMKLSARTLTQVKRCNAARTCNRSVARKLAKRFLVMHGVGRGDAPTVSGISASSIAGSRITASSIVADAGRRRC